MVGYCALYDDFHYFGMPGLIGGAHLWSGGLPTSTPFRFVTPRYKELEKLMKFIGQWQEDYLDTWIRNRWPTQAFSDMGSALWNWRFWGVAFMDSIAATLYTTNECVLKYGLSFTDQQLH